MNPNKREKRREKKTIILPLNRVHNTICATSLDALPLNPSNDILVGLFGHQMSMHALPKGISILFLFFFVNRRN